MFVQKLGWVAVGMVLAASPGKEAAPAFTLRDTSGQPVNAKGYAGSVMWITFGATW